MRFQSSLKLETKIFFTIWLCLSFFLSPMMLGLSLTPTSIAPQAQATIPTIDWAHIGTSIVNFVQSSLKTAWATAQDWARTGWAWVAQNAFDLAIKAAKAALKVLMHQILAQVTNSIIKWIQSDFQGQPGFITDWQSYLKKASNAAAGRFLNTLTGVNLCSAFKPKIKLVFALPVPQFNTEAACTLDKIMANANATINDFYSDFSKGGWVAWEESMKPNNRAFSAYLMTLDAKRAEEFAEIQKKEKETKSGFKGTKKCLSAANKAQLPKEQLESNQLMCDSTRKILSGGVEASGYTQEQYNAIVAGYERDCTGTGTPVTSGDASKIDADSKDCASSITTMPDGTVAYNVNFASNSAMQVLQDEIAGLIGEGTGSQFTPYILAITNALITQLVKDGISGLLAANPQEENLDSGTNSITVSTNSDTYTSIATDAATAQQTLAHISQIGGSNSLVSQSKSRLDAILSTVQSIKNKQDAVINDLWGQGNWTETNTVATIISGPTTNTIGNTTTVYTTYKISNPKIGEATIGQTVTTIVDPITGPSTTTSYAMISSMNQIEDIDGIVSAYQDRVNTLSGLIAVAPTLKTTTDTFISAAAAYASAWQNDPTKADPTAAKSARDSLVTQLQNATGSTSNSLVELNTALGNIITGTSTDMTGIMITITNTDGSVTTELASAYYQDYYNAVVAIYNTLQQANPAP